VQLWAEPIMFTLPFLCLVMDICPYGMDSLLYWTHIAHLCGQFFHSSYHRDWESFIRSLQVIPLFHLAGFVLCFFSSFF
jgi:hypothetical protein